MADVIIIQRVITHYRLPVFERLWREFGWVVATAKTPPDNTGLNLVEGNYDFIRRYDFRFPNPKNAYRCNIPLSQILRDTSARAVIAEFSMYMNSSYLLPIRRRLRGSPITLFWSHGYNMGRGLNNVFQRFAQMPRVALSALVDGHVCYSEEGRTYLARFMPRARLFVARNTVDMTALQKRADSVPPTTPIGRPHLLTIGRITQDKDFPRLVQVFHMLREKFPDAVLTIIGDGPDASRTRTAAGDELGGSVRMVGAEYEEERLAGYYRSADIVVFPGAVGLSVNHALAHGVPVIAYDRTSTGPHHYPEIAYVVNDVTGMRVPTYTDEAMLEALRSFLTRHPDPKADFSDAIAHYVAENLSLDRMIEDFRGIHEHLRSLGVGIGCS